MLARKVRVRGLQRSDDRQRAERDPGPPVRPTYPPRENTRNRPPSLLQMKQKPIVLDLMRPFRAAGTALPRVGKHVHWKPASRKRERTSARAWPSEHLRHESDGIKLEIAPLG